MSLTTKSIQKVSDESQDILASLKLLGDKRIRDEMGSRYGIYTDKAFGVPMNKMQQLARSVGKNHELAAALWSTGWYEARIVAAFVEEADRVTSAQMDRWCRDFDNWGICDTVCFKLFDRTPYAFDKVLRWSKRPDEFVRRAAFALLACLALHDKKASNAQFMKCLPLIEQAAGDERNFVKKGVSWALRSIARRNLELNAAAVSLARQLSDSENATSRWIGKTALNEFASSAKKEKVRTQASKAKRTSIK